MPEQEPSEEATTDSIELSYERDELSEVRVAVTHKTREVIGGEQLVDEVITTEVTYTIDGGVAEMTGFYPDANTIGDDLHCETLKAIRCLPHAYEEVQSRVNDSIDVKAPYVAIDDEYELGL